MVTGRPIGRTGRSLRSIRDEHRHGDPPGVHRLRSGLLSRHSPARLTRWSRYGTCWPGRHQLVGRGDVPSGAGRSPDRTVTAICGRDPRSGSQRRRPVGDRRCVQRLVDDARVGRHRRGDRRLTQRNPLRDQHGSARPKAARAVRKAARHERRRGSQDGRRCRINTAPSPWFPSPTGSCRRTNSSSS